jgi:hypothetical protein
MLFSQGQLCLLHFLNNNKPLPRFPDGCPYTVPENVEKNKIIAESIATIYVTMV